MLGFFNRTPATRKNYSDCSGCSLCLLVCPVWRQNRDISLTPQGHFKAMQHGISAASVAASTENCTLCMACEPVCPENIDIIGTILELRRQLVLWERPPGRDRLYNKVRQSTDETTSHPTRQPKDGCQVAGYIQQAGCGIDTRGQEAAPTNTSSTMLLPDHALHAHPDILARVAALLGSVPISDDDGSDISLALESGTTIPEQRLQRFLAPLRRLKKILVADGLLLHHLRQWLPKANIIGLGEALSGHAVVRRGLRPTDLYVIEPRAYHADYQRLVKHYDRLRTAHGCAFNLDLQRIAIPATARSLPQRLGLTAPNDDGQARWVLHRRNITRIVVESMEEHAALEKVSGFPVVHLADLADDGHGSNKSS